MKRISALIISLFLLLSSFAYATTLSMLSHVKGDFIEIGSNDTLITNDHKLDINSLGISIYGTLIAGTDTILCAGDWTLDNSGTFVDSTSTVVFDSDTIQVITGENTFHNLSIRNLTSAPADTADVDADSLIVTNMLLIEDGQFQPANGSQFAAISIGSNGVLKPDSGAVISASENWSNSGTFTHNNGKINLNGSNRSLSGSTVFYKLYKVVTTDDTLTFDCHATQTITNELTLQGAAGNLLALRSDTAGVQFGITLSPGGSQTLSYLNVKDSDASGGNELSATHSTNSGNNLNWDFTAAAICANINVWLEGPYDNVGDSMRTTINDSIPLTSPYTDSLIVEGIPGNVVDWVLVELRTDTTGATKVIEKSMFLLNNGKIVKAQATETAPEFPDLTQGNYYTVVRHRNHLSIMSKTAQTYKEQGETPYTDIDLTDSVNVYGTGAVKELESAVFAMYAGEGNSSGIVTVADQSEAANHRDEGGYLVTDYNLSGVTTVADQSMCNNNRDSGTKVPP